MSESQRILLIEDDKRIREFVTSALEAEGYEVAEAGAATWGMSEAARLKPNLIMLDLGRADRLMVAATHFNPTSVFGWNVMRCSPSMSAWICVLQSAALSAPPGTGATRTRGRRHRTPDLRWAGPPSRWGSGSCGPARTAVVQLPRQRRRHGTDGR